MWYNRVTKRKENTEMARKNTAETTYSTAEIIRAILQEKKMTQKALAKATGRNLSTVSQMLCHDGLNTNTLCDLLATLNYEVVI